MKYAALMSTGEIVSTAKIHYATKKPIQKPDVIVKYNKTMGGVDNLSRVIVPYCLARKGIKRYRKLAELLLTSPFIPFTLSLYGKEKSR